MPPAPAAPAAPRPRPRLAELFGVFLRLGLTAFGGPAMVPFLRRQAVEAKGWVSPRDFQDGVALCQCIPGATMMQLAAYLGKRVGGTAGAVLAYLAFGLPAFALMLGLSALYAETRDARIALALFGGLRAVVVALVAHAALSFGRKTLQNPADFLLALAAAGFIFLGGHPILAVAALALAGPAVYRGMAPAPAPPPAPGRPAGGSAPALAILAVLMAGLAGLWFFAPRLGELALLMAKVDLFAMGGGFASLPLMLHEVVEARGWLDARTFLDGIALGQITPGPIVITATFVGYLTQGWAGAVVGSVAIFSPSLVILLLVEPRFDRLRHHPVFQRALRGSLVSFVGLLAAVTVRLALDNPWPPLGLLLAGGTLVALWRQVDLLYVVLAGGLLAALWG